MSRAQPWFQGSCIWPLFHTDHLSSFSGLHYAVSEKQSTIISVRCIPITGTVPHPTRSRPKQALVVKLETIFGYAC